MAGEDEQGRAGRPGIVDQACVSGLGDRTALGPNACRRVSNRLRRGGGSGTPVLPNAGVRRFTGRIGDRCFSPRSGRPQRASAMSSSRTVSSGFRVDAGPSLALSLERPIR